MRSRRGSSVTALFVVALINSIAVSRPGTSVEGIRPLCPTRRTVRVKALKTVLDHLKRVQAVLGELSVMEYGDRSTRARGLLKQLSCGETVLALRMVLCVFQPLKN